MKQSPIGPLVDALRELGAQIAYMESEGCPPLEIQGGLKKGGSITVDGGISSQFISALMMIGPVLEGGLHNLALGRCGIGHLHPDDPGPDAKGGY